jgi:hypothetical protein
LKFTAPKPQFEVEPTKDRRPLLLAAGVGAAVLLVALLATVSADGCRDDRAELDRLKSRGAEGLRGSDEHLVRAITLLEHIEEYEQGPAIGQIMTQLGQWIADEPTLNDWTADALTSSLPQLYAPLVQQQRLKQMEFIIQDYYSLSEAVWMRNVARWQAEELRTQSQREPATPAPWLAEVRKDQGDDVADDLALAAHLFDWTIRNVQLDKTNWDAVLPTDIEQPAAGEPPPKAPPPPPGAELHAWQALMLGHGDAANRARIFLLLARQMHIDVVILGLKNKAVDGQPRPWAAGVVLGDEIYLFDPQLGLPIPGPNDTGIATLSMLRKNPELLRQLDLGDEKYPVTADDLQHLVALIDATPQALSQRMLLVEEKLPAEHKLALTAQPSSLARRLRKLGVDEARIWVAPYRAFAYDQIRQLDPQARAALDAELSAFGGPFPLFPARMFHLRGEFEAEPPSLDAKALYLDCRKPDREIDAIVSSPQLREQMIKRNANLKAHPEVLEKLLRQSQTAAQEAKRQATFWLGLVAYEQEDFGSAIDYLEKRTLAGGAQGRWANSARYNLARVYEATGQRAKAIALYEAGDSPQKHGNLIRARRLRTKSE